MPKIVLILLLFLCLTPFAEGPTKNFTSNLPLPVPEPTTINTPPDVVSIELDRSEILLPCSGANRNDGLLIDVKTKSVDRENDTLVYNYWISGGRIIGQGVNVKWDLAGLHTGVHKILAGADDGIGIIGKKVIREVTLKESPDCRNENPVQCPLIRISQPEKIVISRLPKFVTVSMDPNSIEGEYKWQISSGKIISGQNTSIVTVDIGDSYSLAGNSLALSAEYKNVPAGCAKSDIVVVDVENTIKLQKRRN